MWRSEVKVVAFGKPPRAPVWSALLHTVK